MSEASNSQKTATFGTPFEKGKSGNPNGRPKIPAEVVEAARAHSLDAIQRLADWMKSDNPKASVAAANSLLDRAWGKAAQPLTGEDGRSLMEGLVIQFVTGTKKDADNSNS